MEIHHLLMSRYPLPFFMYNRDWYDETSNHGTSPAYLEVAEDEILRWDTLECIQIDFKARVGYWLA